MMDLACYVNLVIAIQCHIKIRSVQQRLDLITKYFWCVLCPPCPWGEGGHLDLLWFPVTQMCWHPCPCLCQTLFTWYFLPFFTDNFQILGYGYHGQDLELVNFLWPWLYFQGHRASLCFKINFVYAVFPVVLCWWLSN